MKLLFNRKEKVWWLVFISMNSRYLGQNLQVRYSKQTFANENSI